MRREPWKGPAGVGELATRRVVLARAAWLLAGAGVGLGASMGARAQKPSASSKPAVTTWEALVPEGWDPLKGLGLGDLDIAGIREGSERERSLMQSLRRVWDQAPTRQDLQGARVRLPGYVVPLDLAEGGRVAQFLLVPYFGACIHSPPPPANQIIHVRLKAPANWRSMQAVWVSGQLTIERMDSEMGVSAYAVDAAKVEVYRESGR
jgi:hypothetical protein